MNKDIENTELTDQELENVTGGSLAGLGLTVSNSLPGPGGPQMWFDWAHMWRHAQVPGF
jgi:bacteriocin-like protein